MNDLPKLAISIMQPWSWLIANGHKDIENRDWPTKVRGFVCIHAGKKIDSDCAFAVAADQHPVTGADHTFHNVPDKYDFGGIVGVVQIVDCVMQSKSPWFVGDYGFVLRNARPVPFRPVRGQLGFFDWRKNLTGAA